MLVESGKIYSIKTPYYDKARKVNSFKNRPALVIHCGNSVDDDCKILPVSRITDSRYIDPNYDKYVDISMYPLLNLKNNSYIRTGKVTNICAKEFSTEIGDLKKSYPVLFDEIIKLYQNYNKSLIELITLSEKVGV